MCYDPQVLRRVDYRIAINLFVFTGLWFVIGAMLLWSPVPGALGIGSGLFVMWLLLFFGVLAVAGSALTIAAINVAFPGAEPPSPRTRISHPTPVASTAPPPPAGTASQTTPSQTPMWAPPHADAPTPENSPNPPPDAPPRTRRPQRGGA